MAPEVLDDFDRFFDYIAQFDAGSAAERIGEIVEAVQILATSPMIGRPVKAGKRELVIGRATRGYVALYKYVAPLDTVFVLAMRSQLLVGGKYHHAAATSNPNTLYTSVKIHSGAS